MPERDGFGSFVLTVRTNGDEVIASLEDAGYTIVSPDDPPPPIEEDAAYWRQMYEERLALQEDGFTALLADRDRCREAAEVFAHYYHAVCDQLEGTDLSYLRARGSLNPRYLRARETVAAFDDPEPASAAPTGEERQR